MPEAKPDQSFDTHKDYPGLTQVEPTLPTACYMDPAHHERELQAIWYKHWVYVCRAEDLDGPRAFRIFKLGTQELILLRDEHGVLRAFHNTCRHRGSRLITEEQGLLRSSNTITCPYHRWVYSLQGDLVRTPSMTCPAGFRKDDHGLYDAAVSEWQGFVFINLAGRDAVSLARSFDGSPRVLDNWPIRDLRVGHVYRKVLNCNWKIFWENFNECLHCAAVHPELCKIVPIYKRGIMDPFDDPEWPSKTDSDDPSIRGGLARGAVTWSFDGRSRSAPFPGLTDEERRTGYVYAVNLPSVFVVGHVDYVRIVRLLPLGPEHTEIRGEWLFSQATLDDPSIDVEQIAAFARLVMEQDGRVSELNQQGLHSIRHQTGSLMAEEYEVHRFQNWIRSALGE